MEQINEMLNLIHSTIVSNSEMSWLAIATLSLLLTVLISFFVSLTSKFLRRLALKTESIWDDVAVDLLDGLKNWVLFVVFVYALSHYFQLEIKFAKLLSFAVTSALVFQVAVWGLCLIKNWRKKILDDFTRKDPSSTAAIGLFYTVIQTVFLSLIFLIGLSNMGVDISALITGLGVGGIAVALAAQNVLGDLLASLSIVLDKPFVIGDFIVTGEEKGTVEHIGIKTTRIRSLNGEQLIFSNKDLLESRVKNFKRMEERRIVMKIGVVYSTKPELLQKIPNWIADFVGKYPKLRFDRCNFDAFGDSSLDFELVYFVLDPDFNISMNLKEMLMLDILKKFTAEGIDFAFPSQSIYIEKGGSV
jgi:small-conductance mechanosensitive channel